MNTNTISSGELDIFFDSSSSFLKQPSIHAATQHNLVEEFAEFDWQSSLKNTMHAKIYAEEGSNLAEDSGEELLRSKFQKK
jgi:hypothetical protein